MGRGPPEGDGVVLIYQPLKTYGVPYGTLRDHIQGAESRTQVHGQERILSVDGKLFRRIKPRPENIYNTDEKGFILGIALKVKVICRRSRENPRYSQDGNRELVIVIECVSAAGEVQPHMYIYMYIYKGSVHLMCWHAGW